MPALTVAGVTLNVVTRPFNAPVHTASICPPSGSESSASGFTMVMTSVPTL
jgi:hypothetical protein